MLLVVHKSSSLSSSALLLSLLLSSSSVVSRCSSTSFSSGVRPSKPLSCGGVEFASVKEVRSGSGVCWPPTAATYHNLAGWWRLRQHARSAHRRARQQRACSNTQTDVAVGSHQDASRRLDGLRLQAHNPVGPGPTTASPGVGFPHEPDLRASANVRVVVVEVKEACIAEEQMATALALAPLTAALPVTRYTVGVQWEEYVFSGKNVFVSAVLSSLSPRAQTHQSSVPAALSVLCASVVTVSRTDVVSAESAWSGVLPPPVAGGGGSGGEVGGAEVGPAWRGAPCRTSSSTPEARALPSRGTGTPAQNIACESQSRWIAEWDSHAMCDASSHGLTSIVMFMLDSCAHHAD